MKIHSIWTHFQLFYTYQYNGSHSYYCHISVLKYISHLWWCSKLFKGCFSRSTQPDVSQWSQLQEQKLYVIVHWISVSGVSCRNRSYTSLFFGFLIHNMHFRKISFSQAIELHQIDEEQNQRNLQKRELRNKCVSIVPVEKC